MRMVIADQVELSFTSIAFRLEHVPRQDQNAVVSRVFAGVFQRKYFEHFLFAVAGELADQHSSAFVRIILFGVAFYIADYIFDQRDHPVSFTPEGIVKIFAPTVAKDSDDHRSAFERFGKFQSGVHVCT